MFDCSRQLLDPSRFVFLYIALARFLSHISPISLDKNSLLSPKHFSLNPFTFPHLFFGINLDFFLWYDLFSLIYHAFHTFRPRFLGFEIFLVFLEIDELFVKFLGWVLFKWYCMLMHCITFALSQCFMHYRCVLSMSKPCVLVGLDWVEPMMIFLHVTWSFIFHAYISFFSIF